MQCVSRQCVDREGECVIPIADRKIVFLTHNTSRDSRANSADSACETRIEF